MSRTILARGARRTLQRFLPLLVMLAIFGAATSALCASSADLVAEGNRACRDGEYDAALDAYERASVDAPESPYIQFNKGAALYMKGDFNKAEELLEKAGMKSKDLAFEARSQYNAGNCFFRESERQRDGDLQKSVKALEKSIAHYRKALELDGSLNDAAHNMEVARLTMKQILDEIKKQQEEARKQKEKQEALVEKLKDLIQRQERLAQGTEALTDAKREGAGPADLRDRSHKLADEQGDVKTETERVAEQMDTPPGQPGVPLGESKEHLDRAVSHQAGAERDLRREALPSAHTFQRDAAQEMKKALEAMSPTGGGSPQQRAQEGEGQTSPDQQGSDRAQGNQEKGGSKPKEDLPARADETAYDILNEERENREQRRTRPSGEYRPVDKDW